MATTPEKKTPDKKDVPTLESLVKKTPAEVAAETPEESAFRHDLKDDVPQEVLDDPRVQVYEDDHVYQIPSATHVHPDIVKDLQNRGITELTTDAAVVKRTVYSHDYAPDADQQERSL